MNESIDSVLNEVGRIISPTLSEEQKINTISQSIFNKVEKYCNSNNVNAVPIIGGSVAKGTWLKSNVDIDIFVRFSNDLDDSVLQDEGIKIGLNSLKGNETRLRYSDHPYVEGFYDNFRVNIVPCFDTPVGKWRSAADRSPYHTDFIQNNYNSHLQKEARLFKQFLKGLNIYGAELKIQGFSGYASELLILKYGSFKNLIKNASNFKEKEIIKFTDVDTHKTKFNESPLIIIDPVDINRNLGSAISLENVSTFVLSSRNFLQNPTKNFFWPSPQSVSQLNSSLISNVVVVIFDIKQRSPDILWGQLRHSIESLKKQINLKDFNVINCKSASDDVNKCAFLFLVDELVIPSHKIRVGPYYYLHQECEKFIQANIDKATMFWFGDDGKLYSIMARNEFSFTKTISNYLHFQINNIGISPGLIDDISNGFQIFVGKECLQPASKYTWVLSELVNLIGSEKFLLRERK